MDIVSMVFTQLIFILVVGAIGGIVWFAYQAKYSQEQLKSSRGARNSERKEHNRKQPKTRQAPAALVAEPENVKEAAESEPEPEPEPEPVAKKGKKNKKKPEEKKVAEKKPQAKAAPVQAAPAKKAAAKASSAPAQTAAPKKPVEEKKEAKTEQKTKKNKTDKIKKLQEQQAEFEAKLAAAAQPKKGAPKTQDVDGWTKSVSKSAKRSANKDEQKQSATSLSLSVKSRQYPIIIGPKGATLKAIESDSKAKINIEKSNRRDLQPDVPTIVSITGSAASCARAEALIKELLSEGFTKVTHPGYVSIPYKLKTPDRDRALLVGAGGANIKKLQERCGVRIHLPTNRESNEISIVGPEQACKKAAETIDTLLREGYSTVTHEHHVRGDVEGVLASQYPAIIGKKGENIARIQAETDTRITVPNSHNNLTNVTIYGKEANVNRARELILESLSKDSATPVVESDDPDDPWASANINSEEF